MKELFFNDDINLYVSNKLPGILLSTLLILCGMFLGFKFESELLMVLILIFVTFLTFCINLFYEKKAVKKLNDKYQFTDVKISMYLVLRASINFALIQLIIGFIYVIPVLGGVMGLATFVFGPILFEQYYFKVIKSGSYTLSTNEVLLACKQHFSMCAKMCLFTLVIILALLGMIPLMVVHISFIVLVLVMAFLIDLYQSGIYFSYFIKNKTINTEIEILENNDL